MNASSVSLQVPLDPEALRRRALEAMSRARFAVRPVPVEGDNDTYTLSPEARPALTRGLSREDAERYAGAVNGEAELARAMLLVLDRLETLEDQIKELKHVGPDEIGGVGGTDLGPAPEGAAD